MIVKTVSVSSICLAGDGWDAYLLRYRLDAGFLVESVGANGVIQAVVLEEWDGGYRVISGFLRVAAARTAGVGEVPAVVYGEGELLPREGLRLALAANSPGVTLSAADRAVALSKASDDFGFTPDELADEVAAPLGLAASHKVVRQYLEIARLPESVLEALGAERISREHAAAILLVPASDREWFFSEIVEPLRLSAGDTRFAATAGIDLAGREGRGVREVLEEVIAGLEAGHGGARPAVAHNSVLPHRYAGAESGQGRPWRTGNAATERKKLKDALSRRLLPVLSQMEDEFAGLAGRLGALGAATVDHSPGFEADEVRIALRAKSVEEIRSLKVALERGLESGVFEEMLSIARRKGDELLRNIRKGSDA